jgi:phospholipase C
VIPHSARRLAVAIAGAAVVLVACDGGSATLPSGAARQRVSQSSTSPIQHVVIVIQENRTFNDFFATYPGADGTTVGKVVANSSCSPRIAQGTINLQKVPLAVTTDLNHSYRMYKTADDHGNMDGFDRIGTECAYPYQYTDPSQIQQYWQMAQQYTLAEHMFTTQGSDSFTAHQDLIRGGTIVESGRAMVDFPTCANCFWGCDAAPGTTTHLVTQNGTFVLNSPGPFPCSKQFGVSYPTMRDLLDAKSIPWKYYLPPSNKNYGKIMSAFDVVWPVRNGTEWKKNVITPETKIFSDISGGSLSAVSWLVPDEPNSDHPGTAHDMGPQWVASVVNAIGQSSYWSSTAIIIVWDDWGGLYDNVAPDTNIQRHGYGGLGFRVPAIIVSPYAKAGYISRTNYEFGSILKYVENNWNLGSLGTSDQGATSIVDCFNYSQPPIKFKQFASKHSKEYFIRRKPSFLPTDTDM